MVLLDAVHVGCLQYRAGLGNVGGLSRALTLLMFAINSVAIANVHMGLHLDDGQHALRRNEPVAVLIAAEQDRCSIHVVDNDVELLGPPAERIDDLPPSSRRAMAAGIGRRTCGPFPLRPHPCSGCATEPYESSRATESSRLPLAT